MGWVARAAGVHSLLTKGPITRPSAGSARNPHAGWVDVGRRGVLTSNSFKRAKQAPSLLSGIKERGLESLEGLVDVGFGDNEGRHEAHYVGPRGDKQQPLVRGLAHELPRRHAAARPQLEPSDETPAPHLVHHAREAPVCRQCLQPAAQLLAAQLRVAHKPFAVHGPGHGVARSARQGVTAVGGRVVAWGEDVGALVAEHGTDRNPATKGLGKREDIGFHAHVLEAPHPARAAHSHLHLVTHEQRPRAVAERTRGLKELRASRLDATLALESFEHHRCHSPALECRPPKRELAKGAAEASGLGTLAVDLVKELRELGHVIVSHVLKPWNKWAKVLLILGLPCGCDGRKGAPMEARKRRDDDRLVVAELGDGVLPGQFDCRLENKVMSSTMGAELFERKGRGAVGREKEEKGPPR